MRHLFVIAGNETEAALVRRGGGYALLHDGREYPVALRPLKDGKVEIEVAGRISRAQIARQADDTFVRLDGQCHAVRWVDPLVRLSHSGASSLDDIAAAPMPGTVIAVEVKADQRVTRGQTMVVIESMKLETVIVAWRDGVVKTVHVSVGQTFDRSAPLVTLKAEGEE